MGCHELQRLDEERARLTHAFVLYDARLQNAAGQGSTAEWNKVKERLDVIEREWRLASQAVLEHRETHGCTMLPFIDALPEENEARMQ